MEGRRKVGKRGRRYGIKGSLEDKEVNKGKCRKGKTSKKKLKHQFLATSYNAA